MEPWLIEPRGLSYAALAAVNPGLIVTSLTGFGLSGPHAEYACPDLVAFATSGALYLSGEPGRQPCTAPGCLAFALGSAVAAFGTIVALYVRAGSGRGQQVEVSAQECAALITDSSIPVLSAEGRMYQRDGDGPPNPGVRCGDDGGRATHAALPTHGSYGPRCQRRR